MHKAMGKTQLVLAPMEMGSTHSPLGKLDNQHCTKDHCPLGDNFLGF